MTHQIELVGYVPGALGRIIALHGAYYAKHWGLGLYFEAKVAMEMAEFLNNFDSEHDGIWFVQVDGVIVGCIVICGESNDSQGARLRWFIIDSDYQGLGLGNRLMNVAMEFCRQKQFHRVYLTTFAGLHSARHLYEKHGFKLCGETDGHHLTGKDTLTEQVFEIIQ